MPRFDTPGPISVTVDVGVGDIRIVATDRTDTVVDVRPSDESKDSDVAAAQATRVEYDDGKLLVKGSGKWRWYVSRGKVESVDVQIELPAGSQVRGEVGVGRFGTTGRLGACHYRVGVGDIQIEQVAGPVEIHTGSGAVAIDRAEGDAEVFTGSGVVRIGSIDGKATVKNSNGDTWIGEVTGDLRVKAANGDIVVDLAHAAVTAKTANGNVSLGEVASGATSAETAFGTVDIGIRQGVAAWLDLDTSFGNVVSSLEAAPPPGPGDETVEVRARTSAGDVTVYRSDAGGTGKDVA